MSSSIALPPELGVPDREGYGAEFRQNKARFQPDIGHARQRKTVTEVGQFFTVKWTTNQVGHRVFDDWWHNVINSGERAFDLQLLDDDATLLWYTAHFVGGTFTVENLDQYSDNWQISARVHIEDEGFAVRVSGTDQLHGVGRVEGFGTMELSISVTIRARADIETSGTARLLTGSLRGLGQTDTFGRGRIVPGDMYASGTTDTFGYIVENTNGILREDGSGLLREDGSEFVRES